MVYTSADYAVDSCVSAERWENFNLYIDAVYFGKCCSKCESSFKADSH